MNQINFKMKVPEYAKSVTPLVILLLVLVLEFVVDNQIYAKNVISQAGICINYHTIKNTPNVFQYKIQI